MRIKNKKTWTIAFSLIAIDQAIKIVINNNFLDEKLPIIRPLLYFDPMFNRDYSWINSLFQLAVGKWMHVIAVGIMSILIYLFYQFLNKKIGINKIINIMFAFLFSGALCSMIDKFFWNGSLDYILVNGFFTFDLKDVYIDIFIGVLTFSLIFNNKVFEKIDNDNLFKDFIKYIFGNKN